MSSHSRRNHHRPNVSCKEGGCKDWSYSLLGYLQQQQQQQQPPSCQSLYHYFSTRTSYEEARGHDFDQELGWPGCQERQLYIVVRHGTRYPGKDEIQDMNLHLPNLRTEILGHSSQVKLCASTLEALKGWKPSLHPDSDLAQAEAGTNELYRLGSRIKGALQTLVADSAGEESLFNHTLEVRHTQTQRSQLSAQALIKGMFDQLSTGEDLVYLLNESFVSNPRDEDNLLQQLDKCKKYVQQSFQETSIEVTELTKFDRGSEVERTLRALEVRMGLSSGYLNLGIVSSMYEACRYEYALQHNDTWCRVLGQEALEVLEYRQDMKYYWRYGYGRIINYKPSCLLIRDMVNSIRDFILGRTNKRLLVRMGHSRTVLPLLTRLGYHKGDAPILARNYQYQTRRSWRLSLINPFASNLIVLLVKCGQEHFLRTFLNEHEVAVPGCRTPCPVKEAFRKWKALVKKCDIKAMCSLLDVDTDTPYDRVS